MPRAQRRRIRPAFAVVALLAAGAVTIFQVAGPADPESSRPELPASPEPALSPRNVPLGTRPVAHWAPVRAVVLVRRAPAETGAIAQLDTRTPEETTNIVLALGDAVRSGGALWVRVRVPGRPEDAEGWVPRSALGGYTAVRTRLVVDRGKLTATLRRGGEPIFRARVGVGMRSSPTPAGRFYVRNQLVRYRSPFYGPVAFGTSAATPASSDWPAGGFVGIHGTNRPDLLPGRVSHGCIRLSNRDILRLARLMPVGTPLVVR